MPPSPRVPSQELLKYTPEDHEDYDSTNKMLTSMKDVCSVVNETKRRVEKLEAIADWQSTVEGWEVGVGMGVGVASIVVLAWMCVCAFITSTLWTYAVCIHNEYSMDVCSIA